MVEFDADEQYCKQVPSKHGKLTVCVIPKEDMSKKSIVIFEKDGREKWFNKVPDLTKSLKKMGVPARDRVLLTKFVASQLRSLRRYGESLNLGMKGVGSSEEKEV